MVRQHFCSVWCGIMCGAEGQGHTTSFGGISCWRFIAETSHWPSNIIPHYMNTSPLTIYHDHQKNLTHSFPECFLTETWYKWVKLNGSIAIFIPRRRWLILHRSSRLVLFGVKTIKIKKRSSRVPKMAFLPNQTWWDCSSAPVDITPMWLVVNYPMRPHLHFVGDLTLSYGGGSTSFWKTRFKLRHSFH